MKSFFDFYEEAMAAPTHNVGGGNIAGTKPAGDDPPVRKKKRYKNTGVLKTHLILNHLIVLFNVFNDATVPLLLYNLEKDLWPAIKSFLMFLNRIPEYPPSTIHEIDEDQVCVTQLNEDI